MSFSTQQQSMKNFVGQIPTADEITLIICQGAIVHPLLYDHFLDLLVDLKNRNKISLLPSVIFEEYHRKFRKTA